MQLNVFVEQTVLEAFLSPAETVMVQMWTLTSTSVAFWDAVEIRGWVLGWGGDHGRLPVAGVEGDRSRTCDCEEKHIPGRRRPR